MTDERIDPDRPRDIGESSQLAGEGQAVPENNSLFPTSTERVAEGVGGLGGAAAGAAIGAAAGPVGAVIGALAGAVGGWWAGKGIADAATSYDEREDRHYREHFARDPNRVHDRSYEYARPYYALGHIAASNPEYRNRRFEEIEADLEKGWAEHAATVGSDWATGRAYAQTAFERRKLSTQVPGAANIAAGTTATPGGTGL